MSSSVIIPIRKSGPRAIRPVSSQMVKHTSDRSIWRCARHGQGDKAERISRSFNKYQRYPLFNQRKPETRHDSNATPNDTHSSWSWALWRSQSNFSDLPVGPERRLRDSDSGQMYKRMDLLRRYIEADSYRVVFEHQLDPFRNFGKNDTPLNGFLQLLSSKGKSSNVSPRVDKRQKRSDTNHAGLQYDPISGRMVPIPSSTAAESSNTEPEINLHEAVIDWPPGTEVEAKFARNPNLAEDGQFQPGNMGQSPEAPSSSRSTVNCPPGSELGALFTSAPTSQGVQDRAQVPQETERKPHVNIDCSPGSEMETFFVSESVPSAQPQSGTSNVNANTNNPNLDAGVTAGTNVECSPGSELDAKSISDPISRSVQSSPSVLATQTLNKQIGISIDCSLGNELDAKLSSELASLSLDSAGLVHQTTNTVPMTNSQESFECSPGSEIEAHILSESASQESAQLGAQTFIDYPPGSELKAKFACNPASMKEMQPRQELASGLGTSKIAKDTVDCTPGNELEAKFIAEIASAECPNENEGLGALDVIDIQSHYAPFESKLQANSLDFDASEDRIGDFILQSQNLGTENREQPDAPTSPEFHILALDTSTSQVTAAQADSFFVVDEDSRPSEILSRLHNPAKFLPYFEKIQDGGYEIATGGGNILVFRKSQSTPHHTLSNTQTEQAPAIHTDIAKHLREDSMDSAVIYAGAPWQSTTELPPETGSSSSEPEPAPTFEPSFLKSGRRMLVAGTAIAATCYAIGVMTEFFRTGGKDGRGIDGFTVFESDRRRQE